MAEFLSMGGYAAFVWPAYAAVALVLTGVAVASVAGLRRRRRLLAVLDGARPRRRAGTDGAAPDAAVPVVEGRS